MSVSSVGLYDDARFPGRCLVVLDEHYEHLSDVPDDVANEFFRDVRQVGRAILRVTVADRVNYAALGNAEPHVHFHVIPRTVAGDPVPEQAPWATPLPRAPLPPAVAADLVRDLTDALR